MENLDDDDIKLPEDTQEILRQFLADQTKPDKEELFSENWNLSQFWWVLNFFLLSLLTLLIKIYNGFARYSDETQKDFGKIVKNLLQKQEDEHYSIALLSCPSLFQTIRSINGKHLRCWTFNYDWWDFILDKTKIFEYDTRFQSFGDDFQCYDYNKADEDNYLSEFAQSFDLIIVDPPFLSEECLEKTAVIVKRLVKDNGKIILNTGSVQRDLARKFLNLNESSYKPQHKNNLGNEFSSFTNFDLDQFI